MWPLAPELDDDSLELLLFPSPIMASRLDRPVPDWAVMDRDLRRGVTPTRRHAGAVVDFILGQGRDGSVLVDAELHGGAPVLTGQRGHARQRDGDGTHEMM